MSPEQVRNMYSRLMGANAETVTLRRTSPLTNAEVLARVMDYRPDELIGGVFQGDRKIIVLAQDVEQSAFPVPFQKGGKDKIVVRDRVLNIESVDDNTRRIRGVLCAYEIRARGA